MPYISQIRRAEIEDGSCPANAGELNFTLTKIIQDYLFYNHRSYQTMNDIVGALEGAKAEFQRQVVNPYEDRKIKANGGLYL
jgi:hypothetical protein